MGLVSYEKPVEAAKGELPKHFGPVARTRIAFAIFAIVGVACIFFVPYLVPVKPAAGYSYAFGFNNNAAIILLLCFAGIGALWQRQGPLFVLPREPDIHIGRRTLVIGLFITVFFCALAYPLVNRATPVADAGYFINRMRLLYSGKLPYVDFEFAYGPMLLYVPLWIAELFHMSIPTGYYIVWVITELVGVLLAARVLNAIDIPTRAKPTIFFLFCAASSATFIIGGVNYTFFRFALAPFLALQIHEIDLKLENRRQAIWIVASLVIFAFAFLELVSPEIGLAFGVAFAAFLLFSRGGRPGQEWITLSTSLAGIVGILWLANRAHLLDTMKAFAGGARGFPMVPSAHLFLFLICVFLAVLHLARTWPRWGSSRSSLVVLISIPMLASALNSCDPLHVFFSGFGILAIGLIYLSKSKKVWDLTCIVFVYFFIVGSFAGLFIKRLPQYTVIMEGHSENSVFQGRLSQHILFPHSHGILQAPLGFHLPSGEPYYAPWVDTGRFISTLNAPTVGDIAIKERELATHPEREVILPRGFEGMRKFNVDSGRSWLEVEFDAPYFMPLRHPNNPYGKLVDYIEQHYHRVALASSKSLGYAVWERN